MAHIDEGMLQAYLDREVGARADIDAHLSACAACAAELNRLRAAAQLFASAVRSADAPAPTFAAFTAVRRTRTEAPPRRHVFARVPLARAALLLFGFAAIASAAIPGSPVRAWLSDALRSVGVLPDRPEPAMPVLPDAPASADRAEQGSGPTALAIEPADGRIRIVLTGVAPEADVRVRLVEGDRALVQASGDAARARFRTGPGRIEVIGVGKGEVVVTVPLAASDARVEADGKVLFERVR
ncbi:MAG: anti-sigma factor family protein [Gemmatimonadota bacterium]